jgi:hypothetical protein
MAARRLLWENRIQAKAIVERHWCAIADVAGELAARGSLKGRQATQLIIQPWLLKNFPV